MRPILVSGHVGGLLSVGGLGMHGAERVPVHVWDDELTLVSGSTARQDAQASVSRGSGRGQILS